MIEDGLRQRIAQELSARTEAATHKADWAAMVTGGRGRHALDDALFYCQPAAMSRRLEALRSRLGAAYARDDISHIAVLRFVSELAVSLSSFLPQWRLGAGPSAAALDREARAASALAVQLATQRPEVTQTFLAEATSQATARLRAEAVADPAAEAARLVGSSVAEYVANVNSAIASSYLRRISQARLEGQTATEIGNDYAAYLDYAMNLGASFVTSNPPLVDAAWDADPTRWNPVVDAVIAANPQADSDTLARLMTLEVVLSNMRLLRPIFLLTGGKMGYVSLQVNPKEHGNAAQMITDAEAIYEELTKRLDGGLPNVVFKLPGTLAGLAACQHLTGRGIGVNITVNFGLFQELRFAQVIRRGHALVAYLTVMNGRLSFPVRDELLARLPELAGVGVDEGQARRAAAWAGVAVVKRLHSLLSRDGYDLTRIRPLVASLRWYTGPLHDGLPSPCPDVTETLGVAVLTVFPNIRRSLDTAPHLPLDANQIAAPVPAEILEVLRHSEIFKQAYYLPGDTDLVPAKPIALEDEANTAAWPPVANTLTEFSKAYDRFLGKIMARKG